MKTSEEVPSWWKRWLGLTLIAFLGLWALYTFLAGFFLGGVLFFAGALIYPQSKNVSERQADCYMGFYLVVLAIFLAGFCLSIKDVFVK